MCTVYSFDMSRIGRLPPRTQSMSLSFTPSLLSYIHPRTSPLNAVTSPCPIPTWRAVTLHRTSPRTWRARVRSWTPSGHLVGGTRHRVHMQLELLNLSFIGRLSCFALCSIHLCADVGYAVHDLGPSSSMVYMVCHCCTDGVIHMWTCAVVHVSVCRGCARRHHDRVAARPECERFR